MKKALLIIDYQNDFVSGSLAVEKGSDIAKAIAEELQNGDYDYVITTFDSHPENHCSFTEQGGAWPKHCVCGDKGSELADELIDAIDEIYEAEYGDIESSPFDNHIKWQKGMNPDIDSYSAFVDAEGNVTGFDQYLLSLGIDELIICGLATDYCVKSTAIDARAFFTKVSVLENAIAAVNINDGDGDRAIKEMKDYGVKII